MPTQTILIYATNWCPDCIRVKRFLTQHNIDFDWINIDTDDEGTDYVRKVNNGIRVVPTILFEDGSILLEPSNNKLAEKLGINKEQG
jgi:mycoredoxin